MDARITVEGNSADLESLWSWLRNEPQLRGSVKTRTAALPDGALGASTELVVVLATSGSGTVAVLARAISRWLIERDRQRYSPVTVTVTRPDGGQISVSTPRAGEAEQLLRTALEAGPLDPILQADAPEANKDG